MNYLGVILITFQDSDVSIDSESLMKRALSIFLLTGLVCLCASLAVTAQESVIDRFRSQNAAMSAVQPTLITELCVLF